LVALVTAPHGEQWPQHIGTNTVFISYSHADKSQVDVICRRLEAAGVRIWRDEKEIKIGQSITGGVDGLRKADYFLLILSSTSVKSAWVEMEYRTAFHSGT
jgi:hypothetical protein